MRLFMSLILSVKKLFSQFLPTWLKPNAASGIQFPNPNRSSPKNRLCYSAMNLQGLDGSQAHS